MFKFIMICCIAFYAPTVLCMKLDKGNNKGLRKWTQQLLDPAYDVEDEVENESSQAIALENSHRGKNKNKEMFDNLAVVQGWHYSRAMMKELARKNKEVANDFANMQDAFEQEKEEEEEYKKSVKQLGIYFSDHVHQEINSQIILNQIRKKLNSYFRNKNSMSGYLREGLKEAICKKIDQQESRFYREASLQEIRKQVSQKTLNQKLLEETKGNNPSLEKVKKLLAFGADSNVQDDWTKKTPLMNVIGHYSMPSSERQEIINILREVPNLNMDLEDKDNWNKDTRTVRGYLNRYDAALQKEKQDKLDKALLQEVQLESPSLENVKNLLQQGANINIEHQGYHRNIPLEHLMKSSEKNKDIIQLFFENPTLASEARKNALYEAVGRQALAMVKLMASKMASKMSPVMFREDILEVYKGYGLPGSLYSSVTPELTINLDYLETLLLPKKAKALAAFNKRMYQSIKNNADGDDSYDARVQKNCLLYRSGLPARYYILPGSCDFIKEDRLKKRIEENGGTYKRRYYSLMEEAESWGDKYPTDAQFLVKLLGKDC